MRKGFEFFWLQNEEWLYFDDDENGTPHLTEKAPPEAVESFEAYKKMIEWDLAHPNILR